MLFSVFRLGLVPAARVVRGHPGKDAHSASGKGEKDATQHDEEDDMEMGELTPAANGQAEVIQVERT